MEYRYAAPLGSSETCSALRSALASRLRERGVSRSFRLATARSSRELRAVADAHEERGCMVCVGFGPAREQQFIGCCCTFRFDQRRFPLTPRGKDLRIGGAILGIVGGLEQWYDQVCREVQLPARERHLGAMPPSWNVGRQDRVELREDRLRTDQLPVAHRAQAPFEEQLGAGQRGDAVIRIERGRIAVFGRCRLVHFRQERGERSQGVNPRILLRQFFTQNQRLSILPGRLPQRRPFNVNLPPRIAGHESLIEQRASLFESVETLCDPRANVESIRWAGRQGDGLVRDQLRPVMIHDPAKQVTPNKQKLRQPDQVFETGMFDGAKLQALDRRRQIGDRDAAAGIAPAVDHEALLNPVSSAG